MYNADWQLIDETGTVIFWRWLVNGSPGMVTLSQGGLYTMTVGNRDRVINGTGSYRIGIYPAPFTSAWITNSANSHTYATINCGDWLECQAAVERMGNNTYLATITDQAEQDWLLQTFANNLYWIGFTDEVEEGDWRWKNGEQVSYNNWYSGEPNDQFTCGEDYGVMSWGESGTWNDLGPCDWRGVTTAIIEQHDPLLPVYAIAHPHPNGNGHIN